MDEIKVPDFVSHILHIHGVLIQSNVKTQMLYAYLDLESYTFQCYFIHLKRNYCVCLEGIVKDGSFPILL